MYHVYSKTTCPHCHSAMALLDEKELPYVNYVLDGDTAQIDFLKSLGHNTVPQIWDNNQHVGGYNALKAYLGAS